MAATPTRTTKDSGSSVLGATGTGSQVGYG